MANWEDTHTYLCEVYKEYEEKDSKREKIERYVRKMVI